MGADDKKKHKNKVPKKKTAISESVAKEIVGVAVVGVGLLVIIGLFTNNIGMFGKAVKATFVGLFGLAGYIVPFGVIACGIFYMQKRYDRAYRIEMYGSTFIMLLVTFFYLIYYGGKNTYEFGSGKYFIEASWKNGGYVGALFGHALENMFGYIGSYIVLAIGYLVWILCVTQYPIFSWIKKKSDDFSNGINDAINNTIEAFTSREKKPKKAKRSKHLEAEMTEDEDFDEAMLMEEHEESMRSYDEEFEDDSIANSIYENAPVAENSNESKVDLSKPTDALYNTQFSEEHNDEEQEDENINISDDNNVITTLDSNGKYVDKTTGEIVDENGNTIKADYKNASFTQIGIADVQKDKEGQKVYRAPSFDLLARPHSKKSKEAEYKAKVNAQKLITTLESFGVSASLPERYYTIGPSVTRFEIKPKQGVKVSKIVNLADDIALNLAAQNIRIEAPIPGKPLVGIEVANDKSEIVYLREVIESEKFRKFPSKLAFALGKDVAGNPVVADIGKMPHLLIAGATGSGKSVCINTLITSIIYKAKPSEVKLIMIDPKVVELSVYNGIPHLMIPVVTDPKKAAGALFWAVNEMTKRYNLFAENNVRDMQGYNSKQKNPKDKMPQIIIIIDELADLMMTAAKDVEDAICRLAQMARAAGIHLVIATQRPSVDVITGVIKANIPSRLAFAVSSGTDSRTILDSNGAERLLGKGDMLFYPVGASKPKRIQGAFISDTEVENIVESVKVSTTQYEESIMETLENIRPQGSSNGGDSEEDELVVQAIDFIQGKETMSISMLQRYFRIGFNRASRLMDSLEAKGVVGPDTGSKPRKVL